MITIDSRQAHLAAMGIAQWYGRYTLLGAAVSPSKLRSVNSVNSVKMVHSVPVAVPERATTGVTRPELLATVASVGERAEPIARAQEQEVVHAPLWSLGEQAQSVLDPQSIAVPTSSAMPTEVATQAVALAFKCYRAGQVLICTEVGREESAEIEQALLENILRACRYKSSNKNSRSGDLISVRASYKKSFHWPVFGCANLLSDDTALRAEFLARWLASLLTDEAQCMLYFGAVNEHFLGPLLATVSASAGLSSPLFIAVGSSLSELIATPLKKAEVWSTLVPHLPRVSCALDQ